jgi:hypothetical protein
VYEYHCYKSSSLQKAYPPPFGRHTRSNGNKERRKLKRQLTSSINNFLQVAEEIAVLAQQKERDAKKKEREQGDGKEGNEENEEEYEETEEAEEKVGSLWSSNNWYIVKVMQKYKLVVKSM